MTVVSATGGGAFSSISCRTTFVAFGYELGLFLRIDPAWRGTSFLLFSSLFALVF